MKKIAIYSRKSVFTGKGESIENQIEMCKDYYLRNFGKDVEFKIYEDEGFSGKNTNRPEFQKLLKDVKNFNGLICYRLDRISRNVADFSSTLELLQSNNCDFISIKEQFDTSTPMGRAMIYIASVFAQLERETIAERVRDNMIELAKTGRWLGGITPFGFDSERMTYLDEEYKERSMSKLIVNESEMNIVKEIYKLYLDMKSATQVAKHLADKRIKGKKGGFLSAKRILEIIENPAYVISDESTHKYLSENYSVYGKYNKCGYLMYKKNSMVAVSKHKGIISSKDWISAQQIRAKMKGSQIKANKSKADTILNGVIKCASCGSRMYSKKGKLSPVTGKPNYYYICGKKENEFNMSCNNKNINSKVLDDLVLKELKKYDSEFLKKTFMVEIRSLKNEHPKEDFSKDISLKEKQMSNLIQKLSLANDEVSTYIMTEITKLQEEVKNLKLKSLQNEEDDLDVDLELKKINTLNNDITYLLDNIDTINDLEDKRKLIQSVIDEVYWDGNNNSVKIVLRGLKKN